MLFFCTGAGTHNFQIRSWSHNRRWGKADVGRYVLRTHSVEQTIVVKPHRIDRSPAVMVEEDLRVETAVPHSQRCFLC